MMGSGGGTKEDPWVLKTPPGKSEYMMYKDEEADPPTLMCVVGSTKLSYQVRCLEDTQAMLKEHGTGWTSAARTKSKMLRKGPSKRGLEQPTIRLAAGTGFGRAIGDVSPTTCRR